VAFVVHTQTYSTITGACTIFLYISYVIPNALGLVAYGRRWTRMGPWHMNGALYRAMAVTSIIGCGLILAVGVQPPNDQNLWTVLAAIVLTAVVWIVYERNHFRGPPQGVLCRPLAHDPASSQAATIDQA
jgi:amino acid transporter